MQVVILCGGRGTRLERESEVVPKPMVQIGERPILWHIMKYYAHFGHTDFVLCLGYKGDIIRNYFLDYDQMHGDATVELGSESHVKVHEAHGERGWRVTLANTGLETYTGARVKKIQKYITGEDFLLTYGDGVSNVDLAGLARFHESHGRAATVTAVHPPARFGEMILVDGKVGEFSEKPQVGSGLINGGYFLVNRRIFEYLSTDERCSLEHEPLSRLTRDHELMAFEHRGFWQCMDTVRELTLLREMWDSGRAPWRVW